MIFDNWTIEIEHPSGGVHTASNTIADNLIFVSTKNDDQQFFRTLIDQTLTFIGPDYDYLKAIEAGPDKCEPITITFSTTDFSRTYLLSLVGTRFNDDLKEISLKPRIDDKYSCVLDSWEDEISIFGNDRIAVQTYYDVEIELNTQSYSGISDFPGIVLPAPPPTVDALDSAWTLLVLDTSVSGGFWSGNVTYARQKRTTTCIGGVPSPPQGNGWGLSSDDCAIDNTSTYTKPVPYVLDQSETYTDSDTQKRIYRSIPGYNSDDEIGVIIDNGVLLTDVLSSWYSTVCGGDVVSDLLNINPPGTHPSNAVYDQKVNMANVTIFQRSDVKRPAAFEDAKIGNISPKDILSGLWSQNQIIWWINNDGDLRLEHNSILYGGAFTDLTATHAEEIRGLNVYESIQDDLPRNQKFSFDESYGQADFEGTPLNYPNSCSGGEEKFPVPWSTDIGSVLVNTEIASDSGFMLVSVLLDKTEYYVDTETGAATNRQIINGHFAFANLQEVYHQHDRPFINGVINSTNHTFLSAKKFKRQPLSVIIGLESYKLFLEAIEDPEADNDIISQIGQGVLQSASYDLKNQTLSLTLMHD